MDRVGAFLRERTPRRAIALASFLGLLVVFRKLLLLVVFFVAFERLIGWLAELLSKRARMREKVAIGIVAVTVLGVTGGALALGVGRTIRVAMSAKNTLPDKIATIRQAPMFQALQEHIDDGADKLVEGAQHYAASAFQFLSAFGHVVLYVLIGFILAVVYLLEREELRKFRAGIDGQSLTGTLLRWFDHVREAMLVTIQFQLVVAACNAVLTYPVLLIVGIPHAAPLALMIFASGMVPVVGNVVSGAILSILAFQAKGWVGVGLFVGLTFVLHKLESYYLNPRLAARHIKLPGLVLIISLIAFEHLFGFKGLFLSFPFLFVAQRLKNEFAAETAGLRPDESARLAATLAAAASSDKR
jgi:predicted PurR-regulated permease PerM